MDPFKTNVIAYVIKLVNKHFSKAKCPTLSKAFNRNNVVCTYRIGRNLKAYISSHNKAILNKNEDEIIEECNCRGGPTNCPLQGECHTKNVIYGAEATAVDNQGAVVKVDGFEARNYAGQALHFKQRWYQHKTSFNDPKKELPGPQGTKRSIADQIAEKEKKSELAKYVWKLKKKGLQYKIKWSIIRHARPYKKGAHYCDLCLSEKVVIALADASSLNKRSEINSKCRHMNEFKLSYIQLNPP